MDDLQNVVLDAFIERVKEHVVGSVVRIEGDAILIHFSACGRGKTIKARRENVLSDAPYALSLVVRYVGQLSQPSSVDFTTLPPIL